MSINETVYRVIFTRKPYFIGSGIRKEGDFYLCKSIIKSEIISLNSLAGEICLLCDENRTIGDIHKGLIKIYEDVDSDKIAFDLCIYVSKLERIGVLTTYKY